MSIRDDGPGESHWWAIDPILLHPIGDRVRLMSPKARQCILVDNEIAQLVLAAQHGISKTAGGDRLGWARNRYAAITRELAGYGYLVDDAKCTQAVTAPWNDWGTLAWAYHANLMHRSKLEESLPPGPLEDAPDAPSSFRDFTDEPVLLLPRLSPRTDMRFIDVLEQRRTHRHFASVAISDERLATLLKYTFGPLRFVDASPLGVMQLRAAASGGARHETDAYVYIFDVSNIESGLYAYDALRHGLVLIRPGLFREELDCLIFEQGPPSSAAFAVITVARTERLSWKYHDASAYRVVWQNVGCFAQIFSLLCSALGLGAAMTGAIKAEGARAALEITSPGDFVTFAMWCGEPLLREDGLPVSAPPRRTPFRP